MVISELTRAVEKMIQNSDTPRLEAEYIVMDAARMTRAQYIMNKRSEAGENIEKTALAMARRRAKGEPLAYILGYAEFMGLRFNVDPSVLIPRADTETLVERAVSLITDAESANTGSNVRDKIRVLDIGAGSGCIGISIAKLCENTEVTLLDVSADALKCAKENAEQNDVKVKLLRCDILTEIPDGVYDIVVSNPPYIESDVIPSLQTEVRGHEPLKALDGGGDGLKFYRRIADIANRLLNKNGLLMFEIGYNQAAAAVNIMADYDNVRCEKDFCGNDRIVYGTKSK